MRNILALDLGTNSIGWVVRDTSLNNEDQFTNYGVRVFTKGVGISKSGEYSLAAERTTKRSARKIYRRRRTRKIRLLKVLIDNQMCPLTHTELKKWAKPGRFQAPEYPRSEEFQEWLKLDPYKARAHGAAPNQKLSKYELGRAFYHICQRRGFKSNREELVGNEIPKDEEVYKKWKNEYPQSTLGQVLYRKLASAKATGEYVRIRNLNNEEVNSSRQLYIEEFWTICKAQEVPEELANELYNEIFFQRPLKSQKGVVGKCKLEPKKTRSPLSAPEFEEFRMWQFINNIKYRIQGAPRPDEQPLTSEMKKAIVPIFFRKSKPTFKFSDIAKTLNKEAKKRGVLYEFNYRGHTVVSGCPTCAHLQYFLGENWRTLRLPYKPTGINGDHKEGFITAEDVWHVWLTLDGETDKLIAFAKNRLGITDEKKLDDFTKVRLKKGYADLSRKAIRNILPFLKEEGLVYSQAVFLANIPAVLGKELWKSAGQDIRAGIKLIFDDYYFEKKLYNAVNSAISYFRINYNNAEPGYELDETDQFEITQKLKHEFGKKSWQELDRDKRENLIARAKELYQQRIGNGFKATFIKTPTIEYQIKNFLKDNFNVSDKALAKLYHPSAIETFPKATPGDDGKIVPGSPFTPSVRNPVVMRTLHELRHLLKELFQKNIIDETTEVVVELARDLNDANKRAAIERIQREQENENKKYLKEINKEFKAQNLRLPDNTDDLLLRYRLWKEQNENCLYTGKKISLTDLFDGSKIDIEHTFPRSLTGDNSMENLTVCYSHFNRNIKKNQAPFQLFEQGTINKDDFLLRISHWKEEIDNLDKQISRKMAPRGYEDKATKDKRIQMRHYLRMKRDYLRNKYNRFTANEINADFRNRQLVDTRVITRFSLSYLRSMFERVRAVKGSIIADFRKTWGLQDEFEIKSRDTHLHHLIDAMIIACINREKYDILAQLYAAEEKMDRREAKKLKQSLIPWEGFGEHVKACIVDTLVSHANRDNFMKQTKRKLRKRGKIVKTKCGKPIYQQGRGARGSLHQDTFYGAILRPKENDEGFEKKFVIRKSIAEVIKKEKNIKNIVDAQLRNIFLNKKYEFDQVQGMAFILNDEGKIDWKFPPIRKIRIFQNHNAEIPKLKEQSHKRKGNRHQHKEYYYVKNDANHSLAIYRHIPDKGRPQHDYRLTSFLDAARFFNSRKTDNLPKELYDKEVIKKGKKLNLYKILRPGKMVLLLEDNRDEIDWTNNAELSQRLFVIRGLSYLPIRHYRYGVITCIHHLEARPIASLKLESGTFKINDGKNYRKLLHTQFWGLVEGVDFRISPAGEVIPV